MTVIDLGWWSVVTVVAVAVGGALAPLVRAWIERLIGHKFDRRMEEHRREDRIREQAAKAAEYLALTFPLEASDDKGIYHRANQLGWELAFYLPPEVYRHVRDAVAGKRVDRNPLTAVIAVREHLLGKGAGDLAPEELAIHYPNAGVLK